MNVSWTPTTVMQMPHVQTQKVPSTAPVMWGTLVTGLTAKVSFWKLKYIFIELRSISY